MRPPRAVTLQDLMSGVDFELNTNSPQAAGLVAWWPMLASRGMGKLRDMGGRGLDGTLGTGTNSPAWSGDGVVGTALSFDGGDYVNIAITSAAQSYTFIFWMKSSAAAGTVQYLIDFQSGRFVIAHQSSSSGKLGYYDGNDWRVLQSAPIDGLWHHLAFVFNSVTATGMAYIDGVAGTSAVYSAANLGGTARIGNKYNGTGNGFNGSLGDGRIYLGVLPPSIIYQMYDPATRWDLYAPIRRWWAVEEGIFHNVLIGGRTGGILKAA